MQSLFKTQYFGILTFSKVFVKVLDYGILIIIEFYIFDFMPIFGLLEFVTDRSSYITRIFLFFLSITLLNFI